MEFQVSEESLLRLVMDFLRRGNYLDSLCVLQLESSNSETALSEELRLLHELCLQGKWDTALLLMAPLEEQPNTDDYYKVS
jgi:hypothetical protein